MSSPEGMPTPSGVPQAPTLEDALAGDSEPVGPGGMAPPGSQRPEIEALEDMVLQRAAELRKMAGGPGMKGQGTGTPGAPERPMEMGGEMGMDGEEPSGPVPTPAPAGPPIPLPPGVKPADVLKATTQLAAMGLLPAPTDALTPDVVAAIQAAMDKSDPGLYNTGNPTDLAEAIDLLSGKVAGVDIGPRGRPPKAKKAEPRTGL